MTDRGTATVAPPPAFIVVDDYEPLMPGSGGTVEPLRYLNVGGVAVPIQ
jgi:hypothetical protein